MVREEVFPRFKDPKPKGQRSWPSPDEMCRYWCEAKISPRCTGRATESHHIQLRSRGGSDEPENLLAVDLHCHRWIHDHPFEAADRGWMKHA